MDQADYVSRCHKAMPGVIVNDASGITVSTGPTKRNAMDTEHLPKENLNSESDIETHIQPTQEQQKSKKRLGW